MNNSTFFRKMTIFQATKRRTRTPKSFRLWGTPYIWPLFLGTYLVDLPPRWNVSRIAWGNKWQTPKWTEHLATLAPHSLGLGLVRHNSVVEVSKPRGEGFGEKIETVQVGYFNLKNWGDFYIFFWKGRFKQIRGKFPRDSGILVNYTNCRGKPWLWLNLFWNAKKNSRFREDTLPIAYPAWN